jgi:heme-degrading monooxygenase HmoA
MFIAMNRFRVKRGNEDAFEDVWRNRERHLSKMEGFVQFSLLKGPERDDHTLYASHTVWRDRDTFLAWTKSQAFRDAHRNAGDNKPLYLGPPDFEGFDAVITETA